MADEDDDVESLDFLPENLRNSLLDFQKEGIKFGIRNNGRCLVGDEMGLGKTLQALSIACYYKNEWPLLIVVPSSMKYPWIEEIEKWIVDLQPGDINLIRSGTDVSNISTSKISIIGYGLCFERRSSQLLVKTLKEQDFKMVILDESHYLKNRTTGRTKLLHPIARSAKRTILLTGTPSLARPEELYVQLDIVCPGKFGSFTNFATRYCDAHYEFIGKMRRWNTRGASKLDELHQRLHSGIMIRRLKKNVLTQLPPKRRQKIVFDIPDSEYKKDLLQSKAEFKQYHEIVKSKETTPSQKKEALFELNRTMGVLYQYTGLAKAGSVQQYISDLLDGMDNKFIVFCRHKRVVTAVIQQLAKKNVRYICIDGSVPSAVRGTMVNQFQTNPLFRVAVLAIEAASFGLTLTAADHVVFAELHFTPGVMMQAEDRAHRIGQVNAVNVHYLVGKGTLDEVLWGMMKRKIYVTSSALDGTLAELQAEDGDEETSKQLSICAAWLNEETEDGDDGKNYLFSQTSKKGHKQVEGQRDLRSFFTPPTKSHCDLTNTDSDEELAEISMSIEKEYSASSCSESPLITIEDSSDDGGGSDDGCGDGDDELCNEDDLASMLVEDEENGQEATTNQTTPPPSISSKKKTQFPKPKKQSPSISIHLHEFSEYTDSEDIFNSYIRSDNDEDEIKEGELDTENGEDEANYSSSTLSLSSSEENEQNDTEKFLNVPKHNEILARDHSSALKEENSVEKPDVLKAKEDDVSAKVLNRNPFSLKHKGSKSLLGRKQSEKINSNRIIKGKGKAILERDSDDEDFQLPMPKMSCEDDVIVVSKSKCATLITQAKNYSVTLQGLHSELNCSQNARKTNLHLEENASASKAVIGSQGKEDSQITAAEKEEKDKQEQSLTLITEVHKDLHVEAITTESSETSTCIKNEEAVELKDEATLFAESNERSFIPSERDGSLQRRESTTVQTIESCHHGGEDVEEEDEKVQLSTLQDENCPWSCSACTFINDSQMIECSMCFTSKPKTQIIATSTAKSSRKTTTSVTMKGDCNANKASKTRKLISNQNAATSTACSSTEIALVQTKSSIFRQSSSENDDDDFKEPFGQWSCSACTFLNDAMLIECSVCMTPRRRSQRRTPSHWSTSSCEKRWQKRKRASESSRKRTRVVNHQNSLSEEMGENSSDSDVLEEKPSLIERKRQIKQSSRKRLRLETEDETTNANTLRKTSEKDKETKKREFEVKDRSNENEIVDEPSPSAVEQQKHSSQNDRKRPRLENEDETSIQTHTKDATRNEVESSKQNRNNCQSENVESRSECDSHEKLNQIMDIEQSANSQFMLHFSDSEATDNEAHNNEISLENEQNKLQEPIVFALETTESSTKTRQSKELEKQTDRNEVLENRTQKQSKERLQECSVGLENVEMTARNKTKNCEYLAIVENANLKVADNAQHNMFQQEEMVKVLKKKKLFVNNLVKERHTDTNSQNDNKREEEVERVAGNDEQFIDNSLKESEENAKCNERGQNNKLVEEEGTEKAVGNEDSLVKESENKEETLQNESLTELQEAAEEIFGADSEMMDDLEAIESVCTVGNERKETKVKPKEPPPPLSLRFSRSLYTDRVFLYDEDGSFLKCNFQMSDISDNNKEDLPYLLQNEHNYKQAKTMTLLWKRLGMQMQRIVIKSKIIFKDPFEAYQLSRNTKKEASTIRHWTKEICLQQVQKAAEKVGGDVRRVVRPQDRKRQKKNNLPTVSRKPSEQSTTSSEVEEISCMQAFGPDGAPLCLFCRAPVDYGSLGNEWDCRFCSFDCKENYQMRISSTATRRKLFDAEQGICQLCHFDAHAFYTNVKALHKKERRPFLEESVYAGLPLRLLNRMILDPKEGMFWEADHIVAVAEGGGECGIENLRTLCIPCHKKVTRDLLIRLRSKRKTVDTTGSQNITGFFTKT